MPHCKVLPPGELRDVIREPSVLTAAVLWHW